VRDLEQKVDNILSLLNTTEQTSATDLGPPQAAQGRNAPIDTWYERAGGSAPTTTVTVQPNLPTSLPTHHIEHGVPLNDTLRITLDEADRILEQFRTDKLPNFPFVDISGFRAQDMVQHSPMLLRAILYSCPDPSWSNMFEMEKLFRQSIAMRIVIQHEKSIDLLQAILAFVAW
jgi:hypothetical protein